MAFLHKMYLYLKSNDSERWLTVQLVDGHIPRIAGLSGEDTQSVVDNFEPAIWFKVMVLQSINIDCGKRLACWTNGTLNKDGEPITHWLSGDDAFYDWDDDIDELFNLASVLILINPLAEANEEKRKQQVKEYERNLFKMLHCYILPKIQLHPCDLKSVQTALEAQNKSIAKLEDVALMHTRLAEHYLNQMRNVREVEILPAMEELVDNNIVTEELRTVLLYDIKKAEPILRGEIDKAQKRVDHLKKTMSMGAVSLKVASDLTEARRDRDEVHKSLVKLLMGKELAYTSIDTAEQVKNAKVELTESCVQYIRFYRRVQEEKKFTQGTFDKKLLALSVRECIKSVIIDLNKDEPAFGDDPEIRPCKPEWQTLSQRLTTIVHNKQHPVGIKFTSFTHSLEQTYRKILRSAEHIVFGSSRFMTSFNDFYVISEQDLGLNKLYLEDQRNIILGHLCQISELLAEHFSKRTQMFLRKIRLCYEKCFFNRIGRDLILVYRVVHGKAMQMLEKRITGLREVSLGKLGLQMKNEWWLELFESKEDDSSSFSNSDDHSLRDGYSHEFGDNESSSDFEEEEFCSDNECNRGKKIPLYGHTGKEHNMIKKNLLKSKTKVLSRSMPNLAGIALIQHQASELSKTFEDKSNSEFSSDMFGRYMAAESKEEIMPGKIRHSLRKCHSVDIVQKGFPLLETVELNTKSPSRSTNDLRLHTDTFDIHFGKALGSIKGIFMNSSPLKKMQCLTTALRQIACKVEELRLRCYENIEEVDHAKVAVTAEDLLPLLVLVLLKMAPHDVAKLYAELLFISDLMADFLSSGCHSYALCEFQIAFRVLDQTCDELNL